VSTFRLALRSAELIVICQRTRPSTIEVILTAPESPYDLPTPATVIEYCEQQDYHASHVSFPDAASPLFCIKFGYDITKDEVLKQVLIGSLVNAVPNTAVFVPKVFSAFACAGRNYIVMEYIRGRDSTTSKGDLPKIAAAVQQLISIPSDRISPGLIKHHFFYDWVSTAPYPSVKHLQAQINRVPTLNSSSTSRASN
jgi:hypothetical protein